MKLLKSVLFGQQNIANMNLFPRHLPTFFLLLTACTAVITAILIQRLISGSHNTQGLQPHTLSDASAEEIGQAAIHYTSLRFEVTSGTPTVLRVRRVTNAQLPQYGIDALGFGGPEPPLALILLEGDFDVRNLDRSHVMRDPTQPWYVRYIVYVFDLRAGGPTYIQVSANREQFNVLLEGP